MFGQLNICFVSLKTVSCGVNWEATPEPPNHKCLPGALFGGTPSVQTNHPDLLYQSGVNIKRGHVSLVLSSMDWANKLQLVATVGIVETHWLHHQKHKTAKSGSGGKATRVSRLPHGQIRQPIRIFHGCILPSLNDFSKKPTRLISVFGQSTEVRYVSNRDLDPRQKTGSVFVLLASLEPTLKRVLSKNTHPSSWQHTIVDKMLQLVGGGCIRLGW